MQIEKSALKAVLSDIGVKSQSLELRRCVVCCGSLGPAFSARNHQFFFKISWNSELDLNYLVNDAINLRINVTKKP